MKPTKPIKITITILLLLIQVAVFAQTTVNYTYDASGNRITRRIITVYKMAIAKSTPNDSIPTITDAIKSLTTADGTISEGDIKVFPNPVQEKLNVQFNGTATSEGCSLQLYDGVGKLFYKESTMQNLTEVDMQQAKTGMYYLVVVCKDGKRLYWKVVKE